MASSLPPRIPSSSSSSSSLVAANSVEAGWEYDVFLSFCGKDTRNEFTGFLYKALVGRDLKAYKDDEELRIGKLIRPELLRAIEQSRSAVVILSENYADSTWCLDELNKIVQRLEAKKLILYPVFYKVDPSDVRRQRENFDLAKYETNPETAEKVDSWRHALHKVGHTAGLHVKGERCETIEVSEIVHKIYIELEHTSPIGLDEKIEKLEYLLGKLSCRKEDVERELGAHELQRGTKRKREVVNYWLDGVERAKTELEFLKRELRENADYSFSYGHLRKRVKGLIEQVTSLSQESSFPDGITIDVHEPVRVKFPTAQVVLGKTFKANCEEVLTYLKDDQVSSIGIYGMGGVGKTTVMEHVHNQILADRATFGDVCWVTVSQDFSIRRLQNDISRKLNCFLPNEDDEKSRAAYLYAILEKMNGRYILILDDVWEYIPLEEVGIPVGINLWRLIITTRSLEVCNKMVCQQKIKISPLFWEEAWELFMEKLGPHEEFMPEVKTTAKDVARKCGGLPLAIKTMASSMRGVSDIYEWKDALEELEKPETFTIDGTESNVVKILKYSYDRLHDEESKECFLSCALYPEDYNIPQYELIHYCIVKGLIKQRDNWRAKIHKGHATIDKLKKCCLLEYVYKRHGESLNGKYGEYVKMHDLVRVMALHIMKSEKHQEVMVKGGFKLTKIPKKKEWTKDLEVVSLIDSEIRKIPNGRSPRCPKLSTLMLRGNEYLTKISGSFFVGMHNLRVLNLRDNKDLAVLPNSVGDLINLNVLWLGGCHQLCRIPSLTKLKKLKELDLSNTEISFAPDGLGELKSLRCLYMDCSADIKELMELQQLQVFRGWARDVSDYNALLMSKWLQRLWEYRLCVTSSDSLCGWYDPSAYEGDGNKLVLEGLSLGERGVVDVPCGIKQLSIINCHDTGECLLEFGLRGKNARARELKEIEIYGCHEVEWVVAMPSSSPDVQLHGIEELLVYKITNMKGIFNWWEYRDSTPSTIPIPTPSCRGGGEFNQSSFSKLKRLYIFECDRLEVGLTVNCLFHLPALEVLSINACRGLKVIIGEGRGGEDHHGYHNNIHNITLPYLKEFKLNYLPSLMSIYDRGNVICDLIERIDLLDCRKLKRLPLTTTTSTSSSTSCSGGSPRPPFPSLMEVSIRKSDQDWWELLELVDPTYHLLLGRLLSYGLD